MSIRMDPDADDRVDTDIRFRSVQATPVTNELKSFMLTYSKPQYTDKSKQIRVRAVVDETGNINVNSDGNPNYTDEECQELREHARAFLNENEQLFDTLSLRLSE